METGQRPIQKTNNNSNHIMLSIQVSLNGFSFCILDKKRNTIVYYQQKIFGKKQTPSKLLEGIKETLNSTSELQKEFGELFVVHENELATFVPYSLFESEQLADYLKFNSRILQTDYITFDRIKSINSVNVYVPYINVNNYLYEQFGEFKYNHSASILVNKLITLCEEKKEKTFFTHIGLDHFEIVIVQNGKLELYNSFNYHTEEDFIYYILFTVEQLKLDTETLDLILLGNIENGDKLYNIVFKYIRNVKILVQNQTPSVDVEFDDVKRNFVQYNCF